MRHSRPILGQRNTETGYQYADAGENYRSPGGL